MSSKKSRYVTLDRLNTKTKAQYAREIGKSQTHVNNLIREGKLKAEEVAGVEFVITNNPM